MSLQPSRVAYPSHKLNSLSVFPSHFSGFLFFFCSDMPDKKKPYGKKDTFDLILIYTKPKLWNKQKNKEIKANRTWITIIANSCLHVSKRPINLSLAEWQCCLPRICLVAEVIVPSPPSSPHRRYANKRQFRMLIFKDKNLFFLIETWSSL